MKNRIYAEMAMSQAAKADVSLSKVVGKKRLRPVSGEATFEEMNALNQHTPKSYVLSKEKARSLEERMTISTPIEMTKMWSATMTGQQSTMIGHLR
jgi:hypothetical protein